MLNDLLNEREAMCFSDLALYLGKKCFLKDLFVEKLNRYSFKIRGPFKNTI